MNMRKLTFYGTSDFRIPNIGEQFDGNFVNKVECIGNEIFVELVLPSERGPHYEENQQRKAKDSSGKAVSV